MFKNSSKELLNAINLGAMPHIFNNVLTSLAEQMPKKASGL